MEGKQARYGSGSRGDRSTGRSTRALITPIRAGLLALLLVTLSVGAATTQVRTFNPAVQKYFAGFGENAWGYTDLICGIQLEADCYGRWQGYVRESTPSGKAICAALMSAKVLETSVAIHLDITNLAQCEIVRVES